MEKNLKELATMFDVLSNEVRLCILINLYKNHEKNVGSLQVCAKASQSVVSQQLAKLKAMGIIKSTKVANEVFYSISSKEIESLIEKLKIAE